MSQQDVHDAVYAKLVSVQTPGSFHALLGGRIYERQAEENDPLPLAVYSFITDAPEEYFTGSDVDARFDVDIYSPIDSSPRACQVIADALITLMHRQSISINNHSGGNTWCIDRGAAINDEDAFRITTSWRIMATGSS